MHTQVVAYLGGLAEAGHTVHLLTLRPAPRRVEAARVRGQAGGAWRRLALAALPQAALAARDGIRCPGGRGCRGADRQAPPARCGARPQPRAARQRADRAPPDRLPADLRRSRPDGRGVRRRRPLEGGRDRVSPDPLGAASGAEAGGRRRDPDRRGAPSPVRRPTGGRAPRSFPAARTSSGSRSSPVPARPPAASWESATSG